MTLTRTVRAAFAACCVLVPGVALGEPEKVDLKPKFVVGQELRYSIDQNSDAVMKQAAPGAEGEAKENKVTQHQLMIVSRKTVSVSETGAQVEMTVQRVSLKAKVPAGADLNFDSDDPAEKDVNNPLAMQWRPLIGKVYTFEVGLDGDIKSVKVPQGVFIMNSPEGVKSSFAPLFRIRPGEPLTAVGESWTQNDDIATGGAMGNMVSEAHVTLKEVKDDTARISFDGRVRYKDQGAAQAMDIKDGTISGETRWDLKAGNLQSLEGSQRLVLSNEELGYHVSGTTTVTLKRLD